MKPIIWDNIRFRASSWGNLLTEPRSKGEGALSVTCQKELIKIYNREVYGRVKDITTKQMDKGIQAEPESIQLLSLVEGVRVRFVVLHNLPEVHGLSLNDAVTNWAHRTDNHTAQSLCDCIN